MILGVGVDMATVPRFERLLGRFACFIEKVMTPAEMRRWPDADARRLAKLFSAKRPLLKLSAPDLEKASPFKPYRSSSR